MSPGHDDDPNVPYNDLEFIQKNCERYGLNKLFNLFENQKKKFNLSYLYCIVFKIFFTEDDDNL